MRILRGIIIVLLLALATPAVAQDHPLRGVALVIGQSDYSGTLPKLTNPKNDARAMDDLLGNLGFDVTRVLDGDGRKLGREIEDFVDAAKDADVALVYYSGHGIEAGGENYLVPVDADLSTPQLAGQTLIPLSSLLDQLAKTVPVTIVLLDACRTNAFPAGTMIQPPGAPAPIPATENGLAEVRGPTPVALPNAPANNLGMVIGFAASPGQPALDGDPDGNSPYAAALLKHLGAGGYSFGDVMTMVGEEVYLKTKARQLPWVNSSLRRVLSFGKSADDPNPDERAITDGRRKLLLSIAATPDSTRDYVQTVAASQNVPLDALYGMLKVLGVDTSDPAQLDKQLLDGAQQLKEYKDRQIPNVKSDPELVRISELADKAEGEGAMDLALRFRQQATERARALSAEFDQAEEQIKQNRLQIAATFGEHAETAALNFDYGTAAEMFGEAYDQVVRWDDAMALEYKWQQGKMLHAQGEWAGDNAALAAAITADKLALTLTSRDKAPGDWAMLTNNMANSSTALADRTGDPVLLQQAIDAYGEVLAITTRDADPTHWSAAENNLAVALTKISKFQRGTASLEQAAAAFRAALEVMTRQADPLGWAELQSNLGVTLSTIATAQQKDRAGYAAAQDAFVAALEVYSEAATPREWAIAELDLADALKHLDKYDDAVAATKAALRVFTADKTPPAWAQAQNNLGVLLHYVGMEHNDPVALQASVEAYRLSFTVLAKDSAPQLWAQANVNMAVALTDLALDTGDVKSAAAAVDALDAALTVYDRDKTFSDWLYADSTKANSLLLLGALMNDPEIIQAAIDEHHAVLAGFTRDENPERWDFLQKSLRIAERSLAAATGH